MSSSRYELARELAEKGDVDGSWKVVNAFLNDNPNDPRALVTASFLMRRIGRLPEAYHFARAATQVVEHDAAPWINLGHAASEMWLAQEAEYAYRKALKCPNINEGTLLRNTYLNLSALYIDNGQYEKAKGYALQMLETDPEDRQGRSNLGFCQLAMREWSREAWANYHCTIGSEWRPQLQFKDEPEWDGSPGKRVVIYGEQGLGDEISFASVLPDALAATSRLILECDPRLTGLFRRSFADARVYGTRGVKGAQWDKEDWDFDASLPVGQLGEFYRLRESDFPGTPYLSPCPQRTAMWRSYFKSLGKPVVGIAWRGGIPKTNARSRQLMLDDLAPLFRSVDAHYVSLQYKDAAREIAEFKTRRPAVDLVQYPWATLTADYDDTAALIAACDYVFCMQTAVAHTAGALGVPVTVLVPMASQWRYGTAKESIPWYSCLKVIRQRRDNWREEILRGSNQVQTHLRGLPSDPGATPPDGLLRLGVDLLRTNGLGSHQADGGQPPA